MKNKDTQKIKLKSGKEIEIHKDFYLNQLVQAIEQSEGIYSCPTHKSVVAGTLKLLFFKFQLSKYMEEIEISEADYEKWFKEDAISNNAEEFIYNKLFGDKDERNDD